MSNQTNHNSENISFLLNDNNNDSCDLFELCKLQNEINDYEIGNNYFNQEDENDYFTLMKIYDLNFNIKQLSLICEYYDILKNIRINKLKKQEIIEQIILFENNPENIDIVNKRKELWFYIHELKNDKIMKRFVIWS